MWKKFKDKDCEKFFNEERVPCFEKVKKVGRKGQFSLDISDQYRLCFVWEDNQAWEIEIVDYHDEKK